MKLPNDINGLLKFLANKNATLVDSPAGPTIRMARNSTIPLPMVSKTRQMVAKTLVEHFGSIEAVNKEIVNLKK